MSNKVLVTARAFWISGITAVAALREGGYDMVTAPRGGPFQHEELIPMLQGCKGIIASMDPFDTEVFAACPDLQVVSRCGVGTDAIDFAAATEAGVIVCNTPGAMTDAVADLTLGMMLDIGRNITKLDAIMHSGGWGELPGVLVCNKTLGLIGFGQIGQGVARRALGFNMRILAYDPIMETAIAAHSKSTGKEIPVQFGSLDEVLSQSDFVSIHCPSTPETRGMFNTERFAQMKKGSFLINTARGNLIDDSALIAALESGHLAGAALDVYSTEPLPAEHPLRSAPNCLLTPHNGFNAIESAMEMSYQSAINLITVLKGVRPVNVCNPEVYDRPNLRAKLA